MPSASGFLFFFADGADGVESGTDGLESGVEASDESDVEDAEDHGEE